MTADDFSRADATILTWGNRAAVMVSSFATAGLLFLILMPWSEPAESRPTVMLRTAALSLLVGTGVAIATYAKDRHRQRQQAQEYLHRILRADPTLVPPAPPDATHRLLCAIALGPGRFVGGFLYVTRSGLVFQQHHLRRSMRQRLTGSPRESPDALRIGPARSITLEPVGITRHRLGRVLFRTTHEGVLVRWAGEYAAAFRVVARDRTVARLQSLVDALRLTEPAVD